MSAKRKKKGAVHERFWTIMPIAVFSLLIGFILLRLFFFSPSGPSPYATGPGTGDPARDVDVAALVNALPPPQKKKLALALDHWHNSAISDPDPLTTGIVSGPDDAPVKLTAWIDVECSGSRELVASLAALQERHPSAVRIDVRSFPRRESCVGDTQNVRCLAAMTRACLVGDADAPAFDRALFAHGAVSPTAIVDLAAQYLDRTKLMDCLAAPTTSARVQGWMDEGKQRAIRDTPLVLANGRHAGRFFPFLELLVLTGGTGAHPALREIPPAR